MAKTRTAVRELPSHVVAKRKVLPIHNEILDSTLESMERVQECVAGVAKSLAMINGYQLHAESKDLVDLPNIADGLASILGVCSSELRIDLERLHRQLRPRQAGSNAEPG